jgi:hypothetical protein
VSSHRVEQETIKAVNKFQLYKQIREELAAHYEKELRTVDALLKSGCDSLVSGNARLSCSKTDALVSSGDANKVFREELSEAVRLILERYQRGLRREVAALGLVGENGNWDDSDAVLSAQLSRSNGHSGLDPH